MPRASDTYKRRLLVTGGAGFIGSNLLLRMVPSYPDYLFINVDCLTYAGNLGNLTAIESAGNYVFERVDIRDSASLRRCFDTHRPTDVIHLAAESHVDRSISGPSDFVETNIKGTFNLLELARARMADLPAFRFHHVSTDEVYGSLPDGHAAVEGDPYRPNSPYSASKAAADHLVRACHVTYGLETVTTNCTNNYGPYQFPEKLIPLIIRNAVAGLPLPVYGDGGHVRDWLYVEDHCAALDLVFHKGEAGKTYNISGGALLPNIELVKQLCAVIADVFDVRSPDRLINHVTDRPGHDRRYALDSSRISQELGWCPGHDLASGLRRTVQWYHDHGDWLERCITGDYLSYYDKLYGNR